MLLTAKLAMSSFIKSSTENISLKAEEKYVHYEMHFIQQSLNIQEKSVTTTVFVNICINI